jgi:hypothetical protein
MYKFKFDEVKYKVPGPIQAGDFARLPGGKRLKVTYVLGGTLSVTASNKPALPGERVVDATIAHDSILPQKEKKVEKKAVKAVKKEIYTFIHPVDLETYQIEREPWEGSHIMIGEIPRETYVKVLSFNTERKTCVVRSLNNMPAPEQTFIRATKV